MKIWTMCSHYTIKKKIAWTKYQTNYIFFFHFYLFRSLIKTRWAVLFLCAMLVLAVRNKKLSHQCSEKQLNSFPKDDCFPSCMRSPFSLPLPHVFHHPLLLLLFITCPSQRRWRLSGSRHITQRIRWHWEITSAAHITQKDLMEPYNSVMPIHHPKACMQSAWSHLDSFGKDHLPVKS